MKLFETLKNKSQKNASQAYVLIQPDAVYLAVGSGIERFPLDSATWEQALPKCLDKLDGGSVSVVLGHDLYQTFQIDKPNTPREEWPLSLPFLLKDLITEKVGDIVADGVALAQGNKLQAYVVTRSLLDRLREYVSMAGLELQQVMPEDEVWARSAGELANFILLQRSRAGQFKLSAFVDHTPTFQRTIRNVSAPLTGESASSFQLDGLALELQRSVDYLSSQVKGVSLNQLKVCCDDEDETQLVEVLNNSLSARVAALQDERQGDSADMLTQALLGSESVSVNLYPAHLQPKTERFTLTSVVLCWFLIAGGLLASWGVIQWQAQQVDEKLTSERIKADNWRAQLAQHRKELEKHTPSAETLAAVERLKREIEAKRDSLTAVGEYDAQQQVGYSGIMTSLAKLGRRDISLSEITINGEILDMKGLASSASVVPNWVSQFKYEVNLLGRTFETVKLGRNEQNIITFELKTRRDGEQ